MDEDIVPVPFDLPVKAHATASVSHSIDHRKLTFDSKVYTPCTNKIEDLGRLRKRKFSIICDMHGKMRLKQIMDPFEKLRKLNKLKQDGIINDEDYESKKQQILDEDM